MRQRVMIARALGLQPKLLISRRADHGARRHDPCADILQLMLDLKRRVGAGDRADHPRISAWSPKSPSASW